MQKLVVYLKRKKKKKLRLIPRLGPVTEVVGEVLPTPQFQSSITGKVIIMFTLTATQSIRLSIKAKDKHDNPAQIDGEPQWFVDNPNVVALAPVAGTLDCDVTAVGPIGNAKVTAKVDGDLGEGVREIIATGDVTVTAGAAVTLELTAGAPTELPEVPRTEYA